MTTDLMVRRSSTVGAAEWGLMMRQAEALAQSDIIPRAYQRRPANVLVAAITGRHYGWDVLTAMRNGHVIEGTWGMRPEAMLGLVRGAGHSVTGELLSDGARVTGKRCDTGDTMTVGFTVDDARRAGLLNKKGSSWQSYPQAMCYWRAVALLCRFLFSDLTAGVHSAEELGAVIDEDGDVIEAAIDEPIGTASPAELSEDALGAFRRACDAEGLSPDAVMAEAFGARTPHPLTDEHLPALRDAFKRLVEQKATGEIEPGDPDSGGGRPATRNQVGKIKGEYERVGYSDRERQLDRTTEIIGRAIESHNDLTYDEASRVIEELVTWEGVDAEPEQAEGS